VKLPYWLLALAVAFSLSGTGAAADRTGKHDPKDTASFGTLRAATSDTARAHSVQWLKQAGKSDAAALKEADSIWAQEDLSVLDRVSMTLALGDPEAAKLLANAMDSGKPAPKAMPGILKNQGKPAFYRANLGLAYAKALAKRRVYEEALETLRTIKPEDVVDPASYFFVRAVAEHALLLKKDAVQSLVGLTEDVTDPPERYKMVGALMYDDMLRWRDKDLGDIARKMDNIERRLKLARGGPQTQKIQREVVARLDELIKQLEKPSNCNGGS
jgi:hypothetical protein